MLSKLFSRRFSKTRRVLLPVLALIPVFSLLLIVADRFFSVSYIKVFPPDKNIKLKGLEGLRGKNLIFISEQNTAESLSDHNPLLRSFKIEKEFPDTLRVFFERDEPVARLRVNQGYFFLNTEGKIIEKRKQESTNNLPVISYYQKLNYEISNLGDYVSYTDIKTALHFVGKVKELGLLVSIVDITGLNMIRLSVEGASIIFTTKKDIKTQDYQLEKIIHQFKVQGKNFEVLDLRFDKPVIKLRS